MTTYVFATPEHDAIAVIEDGVTVRNVPLDIDNRHYREILESGVEIAAYVPATFTPESVERHQALIVLLIQKQITEVMILAAIDEIEDAEQREIMRLRFNQPHWYRTSEFVAAMQPRWNISDQERDALFLAAAAA